MCARVLVLCVSVYVCMYVCVQGLGEGAFILSRSKHKVQTSTVPIKIWELLLLVGCIWYSRPTQQVKFEHSSANTWDTPPTPVVPWISLSLHSTTDNFQPPQPTSANHRIIQRHHHGEPEQCTRPTMNLVPPLEHGSTKFMRAPVCSLPCGYGRRRRRKKRRGSGPWWMWVSSMCGIMSIPCPRSNDGWIT